MSEVPNVPDIGKGGGKVDNESATKERSACELTHCAEESRGRFYSFEKSLVRTS